MVRLMIDDHNVPSLRAMVNFVRDVQEFMDVDRGNVIAIHCKGLYTFECLKSLHEWSEVPFIACFGFFE